MVIDSSALLAILQNEAECSAMAAAIESAPERLCSGVTFVEASIVVESRKGPAGALELERLVDEAGIAIEPVVRDQIEAARVAYRLFGKGRHPAAINLGDCFSYALAKTRGLPLLAKGTDFDRTDIAVVPLG